MKIYAQSGFRLLIVCAFLAKVAALTGCSGGWLSGSQGAASLTVRNQATERTMRPDVTGVAYASTDDNSADVFLTDLPLDRLGDPADNLDGLTGTLIHVHLFLVPSAGDTPIGRSSCNVTVRMLVLSADGAPTDAPAARRMGLYSGAGFVLPDGKPGGSRFGGSMFGATMRLTAATAGFADPLSPAEMAGSFRAPLDPERARTLKARLNRTAASLSSGAQASNRR